MTDRSTKNDFVDTLNCSTINKVGTVDSQLSQVKGQMLLDQRQRPLQDLRISVTDRCNFRCVYCMPKAVFDKNHIFLTRSNILDFEEITRLASIFTTLGVKKFRMTGGEPLLRKDLPRLLTMLSALTTPQGQPIDVTLTTNGALLAQQAQSLKDAGLKRLTVSLDALDDATFKKMNGVDHSVKNILRAIDAAQHAGFSPIKINMVVKKGWNDHQIIPMAQFFKPTPHILRFIEYMDVGSSNAWQSSEVISSSHIIEQIIQSMGPLIALPAHCLGEVAQRWGYSDGQGEIGTIASVTKAFCSTCSRARLSADGKLYTCLFATQGYDIRNLLRASPASTDGDIRQIITDVWSKRTDNYSEIRNLSGIQNQKIEMSYVGG